MTQKYTEARAKANRKWDAANKDRYWRAQVVMPADLKDRVIARADELGLSFGAYARSLIEADLESAKPVE